MPKNCNLFLMSLQIMTTIQTTINRATCYDRFFVFAQAQTVTKIQTATSFDRKLDLINLSISTSLQIYKISKQNYISLLIFYSRANISCRKCKRLSSWTGFEPVRENPIGFRVQRLNHSAIMTLIQKSAEKESFETES